MNTHHNLTQDVQVLRSKMNADARFHRVLSGYDPEEVRAYVHEVRRDFSRLTNAAKQEQESMILQNRLCKKRACCKKLRDPVDERNIGPSGNVA